MATQLANSNNLRTENVCMLFTDIEGSTGLVDAYGDIYPTLLSRRGVGSARVNELIESHGGKEVNVSGDSVFALFPGSKQGVEAAIDAQLAIDKEEWIQGQKLKVRMGLHSGKVQRHESVVVGIEVHRAARISSVAHGGQIVISHAVRDDITKSAIQPGIKIRDLGFHRLKDLRYPEALFDLVVPGLPSDFAPISSCKMSADWSLSPAQVVPGKRPLPWRLQGRSWSISPEASSSCSSAISAAQA